MKKKKARTSFCLQPKLCINIPLQMMAARLDRDYDFATTSGDGHGEFLTTPTWVNVHEISSSTGSWGGGYKE
jgi:hypothetical protein